MKVLILPSWYPPQGGDFFKTQAECIAKANQKVGVIYLEEYSVKEVFNRQLVQSLFRIRKYRENNLNVLRMSWIRIPVFERINLAIRTPLYLLLIRKYIKLFGKPDLIHAHSSLWGGYFAYRIKSKHNIPYAITEHRGRFNAKNQLKDSYIRNWFYPFLNKALANSARIICVTKYQIDGLKEFAPSIDNLRFKVIPNIFDSDFLNERIDANETPSETLTFLNIAIFSPYKNHILLLQALNSVINLGHTKIKLYLAGDGPLKPECEDYVKTNHLEEYCEFLGFCNQAEIVKYLNKCDYMILSSLSEGQPVSILESFSMGKPVIVPDLISDDIVNDSNGIIFKTGDLESLTETLISVIQSQRKYKPEVLRRYAAERFSEKTIIPEIIEVYKEILH